MHKPSSLADGDLASQEELEALHVRTGNTPPGAAGHAPSLPPGLPTLLLRSVSAPLAFAWPGPARQTPAAESSWNPPPLVGAVGAAAPAPGLAGPAAPQTLSPQALAPQALACHGGGCAGARPDATSARPGSTTAAPGGAATSGVATAAALAAAAREVLARTVSCPAGQAASKAGVGLRARRERGLVRQHARERAPRQAASQPPPVGLKRHALDFKLSVQACVPG